MIYFRDTQRSPGKPNSRGGRVVRVVIYGTARLQSAAACSMPTIARPFKMLTLWNSRLTQTIVIPMNEMTDYPANI